MRNFIKSNLLIMALVMQGCSAIVAKKQADNIIGVSVSQSFPIIASTGKVMNIDTSTANIFYYQNQILYEIEYRFFSKPYDLDNPDTTYFGDLRNAETRYCYLVYTKGNKYGYLTDDHKNLDKARVSVDSVLQNEWFSRLNAYSGMADSNYSIKVIYENKNSDSGILRKFFSFVPKQEDKTSGTIYWEFSDALKKIPYSFSPQLDSIYSSKLRKVSTVSFPKYFKANNFRLDTVKMGYDLEEIKNIDMNKIMQYFNVEKK